MDQICLDPQDKLLPTHPHPSDTLSTKHPPLPQDKKVSAPPLRIISGTVLTDNVVVFGQMQTDDAIFV